MAHRDDLVQFLSTVRIANTEQVGRLFYSDRGSPSKRASEALSELAKDRLVEGEIIKLGDPKLWRLTKKGRDLAEVNFRPYPFTGHKIKHWLAMTDMYINMSKIEKPLFFIAEYREQMDKEHIFSPDAWFVWRKKPYFLEVQLSHLTTTGWEQKWKRYEMYYKKLENRKIQPKPPAKPVKPQVMVISRQMDNTIGAPKEIEVVKFHNFHV